MSERPIWVIKYGSDSGMDAEHIAGAVDQIAELHKTYGIVLVCSGSVAVGRMMAEGLALDEEPTDLDYAIMGSAQSVAPWQGNLRRHGIGSGQLLITHHSTERGQEKNHLLVALKSFIRLRCIAIANENDPLSDEELKKLAYNGDNDGLARHIAELIKASRLLLLTNRDGLLDNEEKLVTSVCSEEQYQQALTYIEGDPDENGMGTKVQAGWAAAQAGVDAYIGNAAIPIQDVVSGRSTYFPAHL